MIDYLIKFFDTYQDIFLKYMITAAIFFIFLYILFKNKMFYRKIQQVLPLKGDYKRELFFSCISIFIFSIIVVILTQSPLAQYSKIYWNISDKPLWYFILCFPLMMIIQDTYFYWLHRFMHHPKVFKRVHLVHHKSINPSPWAAYSFHPLEAILEVAILPLVSLIIPMHIGILVFYFLFELVVGVYSHSGYEFCPKGFNTHWLGRWINTSLHHNLHHNSTSTKNGKVYSYGLYFTFWDRIMGTMDPAYDEIYEKFSSRKVVTSNES